MTLVAVQVRNEVHKCLVKHAKVTKAPGIQKPEALDALERQIIDSVRRVEYVFALRTREISASRGDPTDADFDPLRAAVLHQQSGQVDEAAWLLFLATHFGPDPHRGWSMVRQVYGSLGNGSPWTWSTISPKPAAFRAWLSKNYTRISGRFGNHRKYVSLKPGAKAGTAAAFETYIAWVMTYGSHRAFLSAYEKRVEKKSDLFDAMYRDMRRHVKGFGRMGCFDFLCLAGKVGVYPIEPQTPYVVGSSGPLKGAQVLFGSKHSDKILDDEMSTLGNLLADAGVRFSMQVVEDAVCNWQKSPTLYKRFRG